MKVYIVDIDGTICTQSVSKDGKSTDYSSAVPLPDRINKINKLFDDGCIVNYWTARGSSSGIDHRELTINQLKKWGCKYTSLRVGDKPHYDLWIDDKAVWSESYFRDE